jgi:hypothetical protein
VRDLPAGELLPNVDACVLSFGERRSAAQFIQRFGKLSQISVSEAATTYVSCVGVWLESS